MNCQVSKPLKLKREHLLLNYKPSNTSMTKSKILSSTRQTTSEASKEDCLQVSKDLYCFVVQWTMLGSLWNLFPM